jgi:hypothetical protein
VGEDEMMLDREQFALDLCGKAESDVLGAEGDYEGCDHTHQHDCPKQTNPVCCGQPMIEIMDD